ncbi:hypothetical protein EIL87_23475 [Saccharopolyspora rhizosphaerae]|uniref:AbiEi antitoxin C-terminal domain-containing protein n=1 Tax=Saccharopolyspora rhizosphaerae TaxID=2492662 RepID=A0A426JHR7_9PSEU|nr:hypothetical protein [Saccharopolyspora rhizosphaerae]RRO12667.1 hypothetical protein EIL87_23475 [Saccharopolyspora rhizosphaerae]
MHSSLATKAAALNLPRRVYRVVELANLGISQSKAYRWARADGPWSRLAPGIVLVAPGPATVRDRIDAALLRAGPGAVLTGLHAARMHGLKSPPASADIHVLIPHRQKIQSYAGTRFERTTRLPKPVFIDGIPVAPPVRAVMDGARTFLSAVLTRRILFEAIREENLCRFEELLREMESGSRRGTALPRATLRAYRLDLSPPQDLLRVAPLRVPGQPPVARAASRRRHPLSLLGRAFLRTLVPGP